jgi:hypothetical protein
MDCSLIVWHIDYQISAPADSIVQVLFLLWYAGISTIFKLNVHTEPVVSRLFISISNFNSIVGRIPKLLFCFCYDGVPLKLEIKWICSIVQKYWSLEPFFNPPESRWTLPIQGK